MNPGTKDGITLGIALIGAVLGILNFWRSYEKDRIKLRVVPQSYIHENAFAGLCVEVVNLSYIAVTLRQLGFKIKHHDKIMQPIDSGFTSAGVLQDARAVFVVLCDAALSDYCSGL